MRPVAGVKTRVLPDYVYRGEEPGRGPGAASMLRPPAGRQVPVDREVDAGLDEGLPRSRRRRHVREVLRQRPPADRHDDLEIRMRSLQLHELVEVAEQVLVRVRRIVGDAVDTVVAAPGRGLVVRPR